jgi:hypothetical protein
MPGPAAEEDSSASEQGAEDFEDAPSPEPSPEGPPWWQTTIDDLGRGVVAEAGVIQAALQLQSHGFGMPIPFGGAAPHTSGSQHTDPRENSYQQQMFNGGPWGSHPNRGGW